MFANVLKGAPLGNKNAAGPHKGHGSLAVSAAVASLSGAPSNKAIAASVKEKNQINTQGTNWTIGHKVSIGGQTGTVKTNPINGKLTAEVGGRTVEAHVKDVSPAPGYETPGANFKQKKIKKSDPSWGSDLGLVKKGAPLGNKNAAGKHKGSGGHAQGSPMSHADAFKKGVAAGKRGKFSSDSPFSSSQSEHDHWKAGLDEGRSQTSARRKTEWLGVSTR